jgi:hypothetical protein
MKFNETIGLIFAAQLQPSAPVSFIHFVIPFPRKLHFKLSHLNNIKALLIANPIKQEVRVKCKNFSIPCLF